MQPLRRNQGRYLGETIQVDEVVRGALAAAHRRGWTLEPLAAGDLVLHALIRPPRRSSACAPRIYLSSGIHGDEPAGPLAMSRLLDLDAFPEEAWLWCCP